jgi:DNA mismatch repair protein MSH2
MFERCGAVVTERKSSKSTSMRFLSPSNFRLLGEFTAKHVDDNIKKITIDPEKDSESAAPIRGVSSLNCINNTHNII